VVVRVLRCSCWFCVEFVIFVVVVVVVVVVVMVEWIRRDDRHDNVEVDDDAPRNDRWKVAALRMLFGDMFDGVRRWP
jgi:uncharacterized membrane protein